MINYIIIVQYILALLYILIIYILIYIHTKQFYPSPTHTHTLSLATALNVTIVLYVSQNLLPGPQLGALRAQEFKMSNHLRLTTDTALLSTEATFKAFVLPVPVTTPLLTEEKKICFLDSTSP